MYTFTSQTKPSPVVHIPGEEQLRKTLESLAKIGLSLEPAKREGNVYRVVKSKS